MDEITVCLTYDFDAVSSWLHSFDAPNSPTKHSRGLFGVDVGVPRILDLLAEYDLPATWFVPGHTIDSFSETCESIWAAGHDIQHHGWSHTRPSQFESREAERADIERGIESITDLTGRPPTGYRSPSWDFSANTLSILEASGFEWDSSAMGTDFTPYHLRKNWQAPTDEAYSRGSKTDVLELPVSWQRDDFPAFAFNRERGFTNERAVFRIWREQFDWLCKNLERGVFVLTMHPQVIGHAHRLTRLEALIEHFDDRAGVRFLTMSEAATAFDD